MEILLLFTVWPCRFFIEDYHLFLTIFYRVKVDFFDDEQIDETHFRDDPTDKLCFLNGLTGTSAITVMSDDTYA
jgi:hypothetical protein